MVHTVVSILVPFIYVPPFDLYIMICVETLSIRRHCHYLCEGTSIFLKIAYVFDCLLLGCIIYRIFGY